MIHIAKHFLPWHRPVINKALRVLMLISALFMFAFGMFSPIYALFVKEIGGDITVAANAWALFLLTAGVLTILTGRLENHMRETELGIAWSQFLIAAAYFLYYFTSQVAMFYAAQFLLGVGTAFFWPAFHAVYGKHVDSSNAAQQWSFYDALAYLVPSLAAVVGGWTVKAYGYQVIFMVMAILSLVCGFFILILPRKLL